MRTRTQTHRPLAACLAGLSILAWLSLWLWGQSPYGRYLGHHDLDLVIVDPALIPVFIAGWIVMTVAMMLPTAVPLIDLFHKMVRSRPNSRSLIVLLIAGYLTAWTVFGVGVYVFDFGVHRLVEASAWLTAHAWVLTAVTLLLAGAYQFTPLKYFCLDKCRSPMGFITSRWHGRRPAVEAWTVGIEHGLFCIGCCWSLMLLMFAIGVGSLGWMLILGAVMAVEKNMPWGRRISRPLGVALLAWGGLYIGLSLLISVPGS